MRLWFLLLASCAALPAQTIEGSVVDSTTGAPIAGAYVIWRVPPPQHVVVTDAAGHFSIPEPQVNWRAPIPMYVYRAGFPQGTAPWRNQVRVALVPQAVVFGKVLDEDGFPGEGLVQAYQVRLVNNKRQLRMRGDAGVLNDLGEYRISGLEPGRYFLRAVPSGNWDRRYAPQYYPAALDTREADIVEVKAGEERAVDFQLRKYEGVSLIGQVMLPAGVAAGGGNVSVFLNSRNGFDPHTIIQHPDGSFLIPHVAPGGYRLRAVVGGGVPLRPGELMAQQDLEVGDADMGGLILKPSPVEAADLPGAVIFEGGATPQPVRIGLKSESGSVPVPLRDDGSFVVKGLLRDHYTVMGFPAPGRGEASSIVLTSVRLGDRDVSDEGFDLDAPPPGPLRITFTAGYRLKGTVKDASGQPYADELVSFVATQGSGFASAGTDSAGRFLAAPLPPGDYHVYVLPNRDQWDLTQDPDYLKAHEADFPPVRVFAGPNPPLALQLPAQAQ